MSTGAQPYCLPSAPGLAHGCSDLNAPFPLFRFLFAAFTRYSQDSMFPDRPKPEPTSSPAPAADPLACFHPVTAAWFRAVFDAPTAPQRMGWPPIARGESALILAPTGTGKTLAAFLWCLDRLMLQNRDQRPGVSDQGNRNRGTKGTREQGIEGAG